MHYYIFSLDKTIEPDLISLSTYNLVFFETYVSNTINSDNKLVNKKVLSDTNDVNSSVELTKELYRSNGSFHEDWINETPSNGGQLKIADQYISYVDDGSTTYDNPFQILTVPFFGSQWAHKIYTEYLPLAEDWEETALLWTNWIAIIIFSVISTLSILSVIVIILFISSSYKSSDTYIDKKIEKRNEIKKKS